MTDHHDREFVREISRLIEILAKQIECQLNILNYLASGGHPVASIRKPAARLAEKTETNRSALLAMRIECGFPSQTAKVLTTKSIRRDNGPIVSRRQIQRTCDADTIGQIAENVVCKIRKRRQ
ncbi:MAG: hypothetical protein GY789_21275 [Hyphomicrobiales bacterium]|nr:hypothetical protein [Hyphomicrobiales bacterium]